MSIPETITVDFAADMLLCDKETVSERLNNGELPGLKFGRSWVIPTAAFFKRLNDLAIEEADRRRMEYLPMPAKQQTKRGRPRFGG